MSDVEARDAEAAHLPAGNPKERRNLSNRKDVVGDDRAAALDL